MAMLAGVGIAVPVDRELPYNELENLVKKIKISGDNIFSKKSRGYKEN